LQTFASAHEVPFVTATALQPVAGLQLSVVHTLLSLQTSGVPAAQTPAWQVSAPLQRFPSLHEVPFVTTVLAQTPVLHTSTVQGLLSLQSPFTTHAAQPEMGVCWQPLTALQLSVVHAFESLQLSAVPAAQTPAWQVSAPLHTVPSAHDVPFATPVCWQPKVGSHVSVVQTFESLQLRAVPAAQTPLWQVSAPLQTFASAQDVPLLTVTFRQPVTGSQLSVVQALPSLQLGGVPAVHVPA
jgi:hypothetical protein